jgi:hypothetical protein
MWARGIGNVANPIAWHHLRTGRYDAKPLLANPPNISDRDFTSNSSIREKYLQ